MHADDDGHGEGGGFPLYISLSIAAAFVVTLGVIGFVTFRNVQSASPYVVAVHADSRAQVPAAEASPAFVEPSAPPAAAQPAVPSRSPTAPRNVAAAPKAQPSASPQPSATPTPAPPVTPTPHAAPTPVAPRSDSKAGKLPKTAGPVRRVAQASWHERSDAAAAPLSRPAESPAAALPVAPTQQATAAAAPTEAPTPAVVAAAPVYAPERVVEARVRSAAAPEFPSDPSVQGLRGTSSVLVTIGPRGNVLKVAVDRSSGHAAFDQAALNAARNSVYAPPQIDGRPATASYRMVYEFSQ